jgi:hypothetical protein
VPIRGEHLLLIAWFRLNFPGSASAGKFCQQFEKKIKTAKDFALAGVFLYEEHIKPANL